jgi:hypothetical protein
LQARHDLSSDMKMEGESLGSDQAH